MGGSIHCNENIAYSMKEMGAGIEVIKILKEGYSLPFNIEKRIITVQRNMELKLFPP